ncbi:alpha/beta-tubulin-N-acetyltransferase 9 isoform X3 [Cynocephalus volans]|uniref:alpha/beta-tubulin-N-acetyltransferase 9 isoform X3 n=1 Tax=Cynocephalus volans TaxID=110931 RepID=UPI002FC5E34E
MDEIRGTAAFNSLRAADPGAGVCHAAQLAGGCRQLRADGVLQFPGFEKWQAQPGITEESCMAGDVNLFLTDVEDPTLGEIEVMIAEPSCRGKGFGTEAVLMMMSYGVTNLGLTKFEAKIGQGNDPSIRMFQKLHFEQVAMSSVFQEVTLRLTMSEPERQWLLEQTSHVQEKPYRDGSAGPC